MKRNRISGCLVGIGWYDSFAGGMNSSDEQTCWMPTAGFLPNPHHPVIWWTASLVDREIQQEIGAGLS